MMKAAAWHQVSGSAWLGRISLVEGAAANGKGGKETNHTGLPEATMHGGCHTNMAHRQQRQLEQRRRPPTPTPQSLNRVSSSPKCGAMQAGWRYTARPCCLLIVKQSCGAAAVVIGETPSRHSLVGGGGRSCRGGTVILSEIIVEGSPKRRRTTQLAGIDELSLAIRPSRGRSANISPQLWGRAPGHNNLRRQDTHGPASSSSKTPPS
ncbi:hypothetical protein B0T25DRAFT_365449 [Lasiosphaeria hispida]|uniref:Uncharacterized protein n=1 Tax=Lasiosphaeria hispida TaxID=260671 RepID=A0AAJ0H5F4_9PEZI|nr:hypothetical protein B0T25DRAFT_365449 [Lasiosphaeria hispida]